MWCNKSVCSVLESDLTNTQVLGECVSTITYTCTTLWFINLFDFSYIK